MTDKELWEKSQQWDSSDDGRGKLKILESVEKFADLIRADERDRAMRENAYVLAEREAAKQSPLTLEWVGLTDDEIKEIVGPYGDTPIKGYTRKLFDQIEAALRSKNT